MNVLFFKKRRRNLSGDNNLKMLFKQQKEYKISEFNLKSSFIL
ncbi:hypothetical protein MPUT_0180 [Mycoplasma putrefaciens KS1]|uniref:Uncharacterized protein n=1 Tax=Mycoplasma putrefaciens (strain ATCC 15718 / NCTC 10155 / C30 KS-1 / KS-1) TaxID=743965 RepID=A0A7U3ZS87_MYCPK|nr:hypothetical protein MPUT_0180 [Mycoplasma putrefaciens KS1]